jgi:xanthine dehydrogenase iron-sulfur cluster and FAD-binding subunit A
MLHEAAADEARVIAGGQTLVPLMAMRLARPRRLIDIARLGELAFVRREQGTIAIGATTKHYVLEQDPLVRAELPLLAKVMPHVGHAPIRARGTIGGSLANADPAAEIVLVAITLGAALVCRDGASTIDTAADEFFTGAMTTALSPTAVLTCARFPIWSHARIGVGFHEVSARSSDFAFAAAAAQVVLDEAGICRRAALGIGAICGVPLRLDRLGDTLEGRSLDQVDESLIRDEVASMLADREVFADLHASADYRRRAAVTLLARAITDAFRSASLIPPPKGRTSADSLSGAAISAIPPPEKGRSAPPEWGGGRRVGVDSQPRSSPSASAERRTPTRQHLLRSEANAVDLPLAGGGMARSPLEARSTAHATAFHKRVELKVNGEARAVEVEARTSLLDCLREQLLLTGAHAGCEHGVCGACTVLIDGRPIRSCLMFAVQADGYAVTTIEGIAPAPGELSPIQDAFCETHGMQCGYCTPAMILTAHALLANNPAPSRAEIVAAISADLCRCTGYAQIIEAVALAAERMRGLNRPASAT